MKGSSGSALKALRASVVVRTATRPLSTSSAITQAESSTRGQVYPGESAEQAWKRNLNEAREWRRRRDAQRNSLPLFIPQSANPPPRPRSPTQATLSTLLASGAALGHSHSLTSTAYTPYIYGKRAGLSIIDLDQTLPILRRTAALVRDVVKADGIVLIVGTRDGHKKMIHRAKERLEDNGYAVNDWMPGVLTNSETFFGIEPMLNKSYKPDLVIFLNPSENTAAIRECTARHIPTVGIVDTDTDPRIVTYPIPANMESMRTAELVVGTLSIAGQEGRRLRLKEAERRATEQKGRARRDRR
ncbi:30S small subunit ribosomal protein S2 [Kwoniella mangroviensis CBS 10435]|uniref:30S small subunit ribosomal protein S2 n=1 Tax=Kwoniella mangroviensis CBS 10435 TaxID=1331196 RepID=A0A1B9IMM8_9TREE|nr:30S small subunit ribosomal protein S2 [Kwoniella mangroviensis CBS 8507]OCF56856.1 30S small subunit ribosomal protein S2 [Kwoniella mangroviensis CBS 10435]OCF63660.1 30S small subunit ribosomal protein S2 [Kwoniella mangroviensis CBS 8507]OCF75426.1 30S small subunit ribosomal protein S2 [Kwoniella mangroviensis CBS 8886]